jgi:hypothetical protein
MVLQHFVGPWSVVPLHGISPSQGLYLHTEQHKHRINGHNTDIHPLNTIRTHDPSVQAKTVHASDRAATVIGKVVLWQAEIKEPEVEWAYGAVA